MSESKPTTGVLLINLGTPDEPTAPAIRRYLKEFLSDPRVVNIPRFVWLPILYLFILTFRPKKLVHNYELIWGRHDGPIRNITRALAHRVNRQIDRNDVVVREAMTYGNPSVHDTVTQLKSEGVQHILAVPLFPQYAGATTGAVFDVVERARKNLDVSVSVVNNYPTFAPYIKSLADSIEPYRDYLQSGAKLIFSFHGIPVAQVDGGDPYPRECEATAQAVATSLGLEPQQWLLTYQSRFGPAPWLQPYTAEMMEKLPAQGTDKVLVVCPGFATDCLETTEEIKIQNRDIFLEHGGQQFRYVRALNARQGHVDTIKSLIEHHLN